MAKITKEAALLYHSQGKPGKIEVVPTKPYSTQTDLSLYIYKHPADSFLFRGTAPPHRESKQAKDRFGYYRAW